MEWDRFWGGEQIYTPEPPPGGFRGEQTYTPEPPPWWANEPGISPEQSYEAFALPPAPELPWWMSTATEPVAEDIAAVEEAVRALSPFLSPYRVTGGYGQTGGKYPATGHVGLDLVPTGEDWGVYAPLEGEVIFNGYSDGYGNYVKVRHPDGTVTLYAHMAERSPVAVGTRVQAQERLGTMGATGHAFGAHLHFEVFDAQGNRYDPMQWLGLTGDPAESTFDGFQPPEAPPHGEWTQEDAVTAIRYWSHKLGYSDSFTQFALAVAWGESGWNPYAVGDNGQSRGIYQFFSWGRGAGYSPEQLFNPYFEAEINLPYLHAAYEKYGGDASWQSDPAMVLRYGWKYGQGSVWPSDAQIRDALRQVAKTPASVPLSMPRAGPVWSPRRSQSPNWFPRRSQSPNWFPRRSTWSSYLASGGSGGLPWWAESAGLPRAGTRTQRRPWWMF